jgi:response regulator NasT
MLRILLLDEAPGAARPLGVALEQLGHTIVSALRNVEQLEGETQRLSPDALIVATRSPTGAQLEALRAITQSAPRPILVFSDDPERERIIAAVRAGASAYVVGPLTRERLAPVLDAAIARFEQLQAVRADAAAAKAQLNERKLVERAKGILMKSRKLSEDDAYRAMRKQAMDHKLKLTEVARQIIAVADLLG